MTSTVQDKALDEISVGDVAEATWAVAESEIDSFAAVSGDVNPLHMDADYARSVGFDGRVAHGYLIGAKVSGLIGTQLPGRRCLLLDHALSHPNPVYAGDTVSIKATVSTVHTDLSLIELKIKAVTGEPSRTVARGKVTCKILS